jgi:hypothetical protein
MRYLVTPLRRSAALTAAGAVATGAMAYYALYMNTSLWMLVFPPVDGRLEPWPSGPQKSATLYVLYLALGVTCRLWSRRAWPGAIAGLLGFTYGLPSDGGRWAWSDTLCCDTLASQATFLLRQFMVLGWRYVVKLHVAVTLCIVAGWWLGHGGIAVASRVQDGAHTRGVAG